MKRICVAALAACALAGPAAAARDIDGCWKMVDSRIERQSGRADTSKPDCIRVYQGATLVTACQAGKEVSVYALSDITAGSYSFIQVGRHIDGKESRSTGAQPRAAAFRVIGNTLHMMLGKTSGAAADPIVRAEQRLRRLTGKECAGLVRFLPAGASGAGGGSAR